jgi:predicted AAA+ superfamily ATPase
MVAQKGGKMSGLRLCFSPAGSGREERCDIYITGSNAHLLSGECGSKAAEATYLAALEKSFIVHKVSRAEVGGMKIFEIGEKYYFEDIGLRNVLAKNPPAIDTGRLLENAVYLFLIQREFTVYVGKDGDKENMRS